MEILFKYISGAVSAIAAILLPITPLVVTALVFVAIDFIMGVLASYIEVRRRAETWVFESRKAWRTVLKAGFVAVAIVMMWIIDSTLLGFMELHLANLFTGFVCGVELWSFLENASRISGAPIFEWLVRWIKHRVNQEVEHE